MRPTPHHLAVAKAVLSHHRFEFGCSVHARFDERSFVLRGSNQKEGGGSHQFLRMDGTAVSSYAQAECNDFVLKTLDLKAGDEIFQVAYFNIIMSAIVYIFSLGSALSPLHLAHVRSK